MSGEVEAEFVETGRCGHSDAEHDRLADAPAVSDATLEATIVAHRLHASMNICTGCPWRAIPNAGSLVDQHAAHLAAVLAPVVRAASERAVEEARAAAWEEGYAAAETMARCWGHTDHWEDEPDNPYDGGQS